ncbi:hypothetical protein C8J56DRAFT_1068890 [Mycena floridula]|nr:hypothetical protein C8J56DRAFT_1068890 [Mycena floridula]
MLPVTGQLVFIPNWVKPPTSRSKLIHLLWDNPTLYNQILKVKAPIPKEAEVEPTFSSFEDADNSAVRMESLRDHFADGVIVDGVVVDDGGYLARAGVAETVEASDEHFDPSDADFLPKESHVDASKSFKKMESIGRHTRQRPKLLGGEAKWEEH